MKRKSDSIELGSEDSDDTDDASFLDSDEDEGVGKGAVGSGEGEGDDSGAIEKKGDDEEEIKLLVRKKVRPGKAFSEEMLCGPEGLQRVYEEFSKVFQLQATDARTKENQGTPQEFCGKGREARDLQSMCRLYKEWAFQLYSGLAFPDILKSIHTFSSKGLVRQHMVGLREQERDRYS